MLLPNPLIGAVTFNVSVCASVLALSWSLTLTQALPSHKYNAHSPTPLSITYAWSPVVGDSEFLADMSATTVELAALIPCSTFIAKGYIPLCTLNIPMLFSKLPVLSNISIGPPSVRTSLSLFPVLAVVNVGSPETLLDPT